MGKSAQGGLGAAPLLGSGVEKLKKILNFKIKMRFSALAKVGATPRLKNVNFAGQEELGAAGVLSLRARNQN